MMLNLYTELGMNLGTNLGTNLGEKSVLMCCIFENMLYSEIGITFLLFSIANRMTTLSLKQSSQFPISRP